MCIASKSITLASYTLIKLGGSVITFKDQSPPRVNTSLVTQVSYELQHQSSPFVVVLGGGAHGHQAASRFGYGNPSTPTPTLISGIPVIRHNMTLLSLEVESIFNNNGIPCVVLSPFNFVLMNLGIPECFPVDIILKTLQSGFSVIIHGDVCYDKTNGSSILSGDVIVAELAKKLSIDSVLLGTDVDGVFSDDPKSNPEAKLIPLINSTNVDNILSLAGPSKSTDVTGGMIRKIKELLEISKHTKVIIFNLLIRGRLTSLLSGEDSICTIIDL
ncbi:MAG: Isopentenyl phosphate kinase [Candidatus Thorarchaeota archaeon]|nr:MAG: Isopentenyl phosphate kinase [Candidatus Thorarchaeota archaeon]